MAFGGGGFTMRRAFWAVALVLTACGVWAAGDTSPAPPAELIGSWKVVGLLDAKGGEQVPVPGDTLPFAGITVEKKGARMVAQVRFGDGRKDKAAVVTVGTGEAATPIDLAFVDGTQRGLFRFRDGKLDLALPAVRGERPGMLTTPDGYAWFGLVLAPDKK